MAFPDSLELMINSHQKKTGHMDSPKIIFYGKKQKFVNCLLEILQTLDFQIKHIQSEDVLTENLNDYVFDLLIYFTDEKDTRHNVLLKNLKDAHPALLICLIGDQPHPDQDYHDFYFNQIDLKNRTLTENSFKSILKVLIREKNFTDMSSMILHDLRAPVQSINGYLDLIDNGVFGEINEGQAQIIRNISNLSNRLTDLLEDLNRVYLFEINKFELNKSKFQFKNLIEQSLRSLWVQSDQKNIKLIPNIDSILPVVLADSDLLERVIINLVNNAIKYCPEKGTIRIYVQLIDTIKKFKMINFRITDTGPGIPAEDIQYIFDKYYRTSRTRTNSRGFGLGLYISKLIIDAHDGQIGAYNNREGGSTFYFNIPVTNDTKKYLLT